MQNWLEIAGILLQVFAGLFLTLHQISNVLERIAAWIKGRLVILSGQTKSRGRALILITIISVPTIILLLLLVADKNGITWSVIGGLVIWSIIGYDVYLYSLGAFGKRFVRGSHSEGLKALISQGKLLHYNLILFFISVIWLAIYYFVLIHVYMESSQNLPQQLLMLTYSLFSGFTFLPIALMSSIYLLGELAIRVIYFSGRIKGVHFWFFILAIWLTGGAFLLANACGK